MRTQTTSDSHTQFTLFAVGGVRLPGSLISADSWPVFDSYQLMRNAEGLPSIGPAEGAAIRERVNLLDPTLRSAALKEAMKLTKRAGRPRKDKSGDAFDARLGLLRVNEDAALAYAARFGLFGMGPSHIVRVVHQPEAQPGHTLWVRRQAGRLRWDATVWEPATTMTLKPATVVLESFISPAASTAPPSWRSYCRAGVTEADVFRYEVGSDAWWSLCVDPLAEVATALYDLRTPSGLETRLADTFVDLSAAQSRLWIDRSRIGWRSVSAMGALALGVLEGGLAGWEICNYELCRQPFEWTRKGQKFCKPWHQKRQWEREHPKHEGGGTDGR